MNNTISTCFEGIFNLKKYTNPADASETEITGIIHIGKKFRMQGISLKYSHGNAVITATAKRTPRISISAHFWNFFFSSFNDKNTSTATDADATEQQERIIAGIKNKNRKTGTFFDFWLSHTLLINIRRLIADNERNNGPAISPKTAK